MRILGVDIGGTFTDFVLLRDGRVQIHKLLSTPDDPARALLEGIATLGAPTALVHGTTVATNALLERRGAATALITTTGFRDVLAIGRGDRPALYDLDQVRPPPLVPDEWRLELNERLDHTGAVITPLESEELEALVAQITSGAIESVAICLLHSYANPTHERMVLERLHQAASEHTPARFFLSASHQILPEPREYERTSTTVVNAYVAPALGRYLARLEQALTAAGVRSLRLMASDGGSMGLATAHELAARATLSGPAGGVVGARFVAQRAGFERIITFDMGGTSTDVALCDGSLPLTHESRVGGLPVRLPSIDIHTVGAGGGSLARIDAGGALRVGPESAGANPGPACYGRGTAPTVTDANLLLGRLQPNHFLDGRMTLDLARAEQAFAPLAEAITTDHRPPTTDDRGTIVDDGPGKGDSGRTAAVALGVLQVANAAMERAIRAISVERGHDPRDFTLVAFGGAGPLHAAHLAEALGMRRVLVPLVPGVLSALGMLAADVTRDASTALLQPLDQIDQEALQRQMDALAATCRTALAADGEQAEQCRMEFALDLRYRGQSFEIATRLENNRPTTEGRDLTADAEHTRGTVDLEATAERFHRLHEQRYGYALRQHPVEAVLLRARAISARPALTLELVTDLPPRSDALTPLTTITAALGSETAEMTVCALYNRADLRPGDHFDGPAVVVQLDTTTIIPPTWHATVDADANLVLGVRG